jgi:hypothetical protein
MSKTQKEFDEVRQFDRLLKHLNAAMGITNALHFALVSNDVGEELLGKAAYAAFESLEECKAAVDQLDKARMARHEAANPKA